MFQFSNFNILFALFLIFPMFFTKKQLIFAYERHFLFETL